MRGAPPKISKLDRRMCRRNLASPGRDAACQSLVAFRNNRYCVLRSIVITFGGLADRLHRNAHR